MPFTIIRSDITKHRADAIVNAANTELLMGGGVCGAIFSAAGADKLQKACDKLAPIKTGEAVITKGFNLPAKHIIHTAGPVYIDGQQGEETLLRDCYTNSLELAAEHGCESIAFPLISSGIYGYPKDEALRVAVGAIRDFLTGGPGGANRDISITLVVFDKESYVVSKELHGAVKSYVDKHYIGEQQAQFSELFAAEREASYRTDKAKQRKPTPVMMREQFAEATIAPIAASIEDLVGKLDEPFSATLLRLIDATGKKDADVYNRANIDRRLFSKIRGNAHYAPSKPTVLAFAVALELNLDQTKDLLSRAGFALSRSREFDVIIEYFIQSGKYDIFEINEVLFSYDQPLLGG